MANISDWMEERQVKDEIRVSDPELIDVIVKVRENPVRKPVVW